MGVGDASTRSTGRSFAGSAVGFLFLSAVGHAIRTPPLLCIHGPLLSPGLNLSLTDQYLLASAVAGGVGMGRTTGATELGNEHANEFPKHSFGIWLAAPFRHELAGKEEGVHQSNTKYLELYACLPALRIPCVVETQHLLPIPVVPIDPPHLGLVLCYHFRAGYLYFVVATIGSLAFF